jgi:hypothetical protein
MQGGEAADVHHPEIHRLLVGHYPGRERLAGAAARGDAESIEAGADEEVPHFRCLAEDEVAVGGEGFGPVGERLDAGRFERRHAHQSLFHQRFEVVPVGLQQRKHEALGDSLIGPGPGVQLVAAHHQAAHLLLEVGEAVGIA